MNTTGMWFSAALLAAFAGPLAAQEQRLAYRDFGLVKRLRVVCTQKHFGRVQDVIVSLPSGKIDRAVVSMVVDGKKFRPVEVPFSLLTYEPQKNLLRLGGCVDHDHEFAEFDPSKVRIKGRKGQALQGAILASQLARSQVALDGDGQARAHELTLELASGHVAFLDIVRGKGRVGDLQLHPVPWGATSLLLPGGDGDGAPLIRLPVTVAKFDRAPTLIEIIVQDPNYRARVHTYFEVAKPAYDRGR